MTSSATGIFYMRSAIAKFNLNLHRAIWVWRSKLCPGKCFSTLQMMKTSLKKLKKDLTSHTDTERTYNYIENRVSKDISYTSYIAVLENKCFFSPLNFLLLFSGWTHHFLPCLIVYLRVRKRSKGMIKMSFINFINKTIVSLEQYKCHSEVQPVLVWTRPRGCGHFDAMADCCEAWTRL